MHIVLSTAGAVPMYEQIKSQIRDAIHIGEIPEGEFLPSLRQLAAQLRVSIITVTRAYNDLVAEGLVSNEHGRGFVVLAVGSAETHRALTVRVDRAVRELVSAGRVARIGIDEVIRKVEVEWKRH